jgi:hypothetical protein
MANAYYLECWNHGALDTDYLVGRNEATARAAFDLAARAGIDPSGCPVHEDIDDIRLYRGPVRIDHWLRPVAWEETR